MLSKLKAAVCNFFYVSGSKVVPLTTLRLRHELRNCDSIPPYKVLKALNSSREAFADGTRAQNLGWRVQR
jgi:hypothetical protein